MMFEHDAIAVAVVGSNWGFVVMQERVSCNLYPDQLRKDPDLSPMLPKSKTIRIQFKTTLALENFIYF